jgi:hypothetical protein
MIADGGRPRRSPAAGAPRAVLGAACDAAAISVLGYLLLSRLFSLQLGVDATFDPGRFLLIVVAGGLVILQRLATRLPPRVTLATWTTLVASGACLAILPAMGIDTAGPIRMVLLPIKSRLLATLYGFPLTPGIYRLDDRYGYVHVPNAAARDGRFGVTYTIDADGHRTMPSPAAPRGTVVFLGDSNTFGYGVEDDDTYPYVLAREHWTDLRIVNAAVDGWGLTQFHLALTDMLARPPRPDAVIVALIDHDLRRSHLRPPLISGQRRRLEWVDGAFVSRPLSEAPTVVRETPELLEQEAHLARTTMDAMRAAARARNVALGVVLLGGNTFPPDFAYSLGRNGVVVVDLTLLGLTFLPRDTHPDANGHRTVAAAIASSPLRSVVYEVTAEHQAESR